MAKASSSKIQYEIAIDWILSQYHEEPGWQRVRINKDEWLNIFNIYKPTREEIKLGVKVAIRDGSEVGGYPPSKAKDFLLLCKGLPRSKILFSQCRAKAWNSNHGTRHMYKLIEIKMKSCGNDFALNNLIEINQHKLIEDMLLNRPAKQEVVEEKEKGQEFTLEQRAANIFKWTYLMDNKTDKMPEYLESQWKEIRRTGIGKIKESRAERIAEKMDGHSGTTQTADNRDANASGESKPVPDTPCVGPHLPE